MNHEDHVRLIAPGIPSNSGGVWADFGSGSGAFTLALRDIAGRDVEIWSVDQDRQTLQEQQRAFDRRFPGTHLHLVHASFTNVLDLPPLDGLLVANAIHYVSDAAALLSFWRDYLKPDGRLIIVEYDTDSGNRWVPYPVSFHALRTIAPAAGFQPPVLLNTVPSRFLRRIYAAMTSPAISQPV
ncbi:MAG TPA: class I SAM-dependent methyltransferase [Thermomicrobiales bacterium]|nr:class I SAM-dependent methyltransferase [Thermomicrobiales bacterium]